MEAVARSTLQKVPQSWRGEGDFPVDAEEMVLLAQFRSSLDIIGLKSKTEGRHYLLLKPIHL